MTLFSKCSFFSYFNTTCTFPDMRLTWCLCQTHSGEILNTCYNVLQIRVTSLNTCYNCQKRGWQCHIFHFITSSAPHSFVIAFAWGESAMRCAASLVWTFILEERECFQLLLSERRARPRAWAWVRQTNRSCQNFWWVGVQWQSDKGGGRCKRRRWKAEGNMRGVGRQVVTQCSLFSLFFSLGPLSS